MANDFGIWKNTVADAIHVINRNNEIDDDWIVVLTVSYKWSDNGNNYYLLTLVDDEYHTANLIGRYWGDLDFKDMDTFIRESMADCYFNIRRPDDRDDEWDQFFDDLELEMVPHLSGTAA